MASSPQPTANPVKQTGFRTTEELDGDFESAAYRAEMKKAELMRRLQQFALDDDQLQQVIDATSDPFKEGE